MIIWMFLHCVVIEMQLHFKTLIITKVLLRTCLSYCLWVFKLDCTCSSTLTEQSSSALEPTLTNWHFSVMTNDEPDSRLCESLRLPDNVFLLWTDRKKGRQRQMEGGRVGGRGGGREEKPFALHAGEHVQCTLGMFRYLLKRLRMGKKGKVVLCASTAAGWSEGAGPNLT